MKKDLTTLAMVSLLSGLCLSANASSIEKEIAMSRCSRDNGSSSYSDDDEDDNGNSMSDRKRRSECDSSSDYSSDDADCDSCGSCSEPDASLQLQIKRQSLTEQVVRGEK